VGSAPAVETMPGAPAPTREHRVWLPWARRIVIATVMVLALVGAYGHRHELGHAVDLLGHLRWGWVAVAIAFEVASLVAFARLQRWLLRAGGVEVDLVSMIEITLAGNALAMSLPGGAAWSATWAFGQLRRRGADRLLAGWVVLVAGALASFALFILLVAGALVAGSHGPVASLRLLGVSLAAIPVLVVAVTMAARRFAAVRAALGWARRRVGALAGGLKAEAAMDRLVARVRSVQPTPREWTEAFGLAMANWLEICACLAACIFAVGGHVPWHGLLVAYALTQVAASFPITPGGLGVVEGSLTALLVAYGMSTDVALASVLLFRAVSFWGLVPLGWLAWASLTLAGRRGQARRPHPWAVHRHRGRRPAPAPTLVAPDRLFPPEPCEGCEGCGDDRPLVKLTRAS
jgi:putative heme transporter